MSHVRASHTQEKLGVQEFSSIQRNRYIILLNTKGKKGKGEGKTGVCREMAISDLRFLNRKAAVGSLGSWLRPPHVHKEFYLGLGAALTAGNALLWADDTLMK